MRTVRDIMHSDVVTVPGNASVAELIRLLDEESISGVPVVGEGRRVLGIVSRTDLVRMAAHDLDGAPGDSTWQGFGRGPLADDDPDPFYLVPGGPPIGLSESSPDTADPLEDTPVEQVMTPVAFSVNPDMSIPGLARFLVNGRIHRALVVEEDRLIGIVTAFDILAAVASEG